MQYPDTLGGIADFIFVSKYARYNKQAGRRETQPEAVKRVEDMHLKKFKDNDIDEQIKQAFDMVRDKRIAPSMRSMQFAGPAIEQHAAKSYNCAVRHIDSIRAFSEVFYLLLCGCGVGLGLTYKYLNRLPDLASPQDKTGIVMNYTVQDSIEGWADSIEALLNCYFKGTAYTGRKLVFDYSHIRKEGAILKTGGGKAPGYKGLKATHTKIKQLLDKLIEQEGQTRLKTINAYDIICHESDAVLSGGVRRSATSFMFSKDDEDMLNAKTGTWHIDNRQRSRSNNSVLLIRNEVNLEEFTSIVERTKEWGEPGFVFADSEDVVFNPCFEVAFIPVTEDGICGVQFCNLSTINGSKIKTEQDFYDACEAGAVIGTLQAAYTDFKYLSNTAKELTEQEALLGVSITAIMDNPKILLDPAIQRRGAGIVKSTNQVIADKIGIRPAARNTLLKPEGTSTLYFGSMASGIHLAHASPMLRRIQCNKQDNIYQFFKLYNPHLCEPSVHSANNTDDIVTFPISLGAQTLTKDSMGAVEHLKIIKSTQLNWVQSGRSKYNTKDIHHNVSCTVQVRPEEWDDVIRYLYNHKEVFAAVSLLSHDGDKKYEQPPNEAVVTVEEHYKFQQMMANYISIDYSLLLEDEDGTVPYAEAACQGNACEFTGR